MSSFVSLPVDRLSPQKPCPSYELKPSTVLRLVIYMQRITHNKEQTIIPVV